MKFRRLRLLSCVVAFALIGLAGAAAQQITRVAVVDLERVIAACSNRSAAYRSFQLKKSKIQGEINKASAEIKDLRAQKTQADKVGDQQKSAQLQAEIDSKTQALKAYVQTKQTELDEEAKNLQSSDDFVSNVYSRIKSIAQGDGYSIVFDLQTADSVSSPIVWYSPMIDITDEVIAELNK